MAAARPDSPLRLSLVYTLFGTLWIVASDFAVNSLGIQEWRIASAKGMLFILVTAGLLYLLVKKLVERYVATETALRDSQRRWQFALEGAGDGLWDWDAVTNQVFFSRHWKAMLGFAEHEIGDTLAEWESRVHPEDLEKARAEIARHFRGETPLYTSEHRMRCKDGSYKWILDRGQVVSRDAEGRPLRVIGTHTDITERKLGEATIADALVFMQAVLRFSPLGLLVFKASGQATLVNEAAAKMVGTDVPGILRQNFRELESWRRHGLLDAAERALAEGQPVTHAGPLVTTFGRSIWIDARFVPFQHVGEQHLLVVVANETGKREAFERLQLMQAAVEAAPVGWVVTNAAGNIEWVNPAFTTLTGYAATEVIGRNPRVLKSGRHSVEFYQKMWATINRGEVWSGEMFNQRKDGGLYHEHMTIAPIKDANGIVHHFVAIKQDITARKDLEKQLARAQRLESIGMLASGIAHDLNNIFAPILLSLELLKVKYPTADARKTLEMIERGGLRGAGIVRQMLTFARGIDGERVSIQAKYLIKETAQILHEALPRSIRVELAIAGGLPAVSGDATQLHQVLLNLAVNARDAMPNGGRLRIGAEFVTLDAERAARNPPLKPGPYVALTVADTGTGIPPDVLEHIFEPFYTTKPIGQGTGLGLSTVYGIVRSHGGGIEVDTRLGVGTTFTVLLPADGPPQEASAAEVPVRPNFEGHGRRILVVDDEETIRLITMQVLQRHGFVAEVAVDGVEALEIFRRDPARFSAVVSDLMMPRMSGRKLLQEVRRLAPNLPLLVSSGLLEESAPHAAGEPSLNQLGVRTVLRKPYTEAELLAALEGELEPARVS